MRQRRGRKRALGTRVPMTLRQAPNHRWSVDLPSDSFTEGRRFRIFAAVDDFSRECLALVADTSHASSTASSPGVGVLCRSSVTTVLS